MKINGGFELHRWSSSALSSSPSFSPSAGKKRKHSREPIKQTGSRSGGLSWRMFYSKWGECVQSAEVIIQQCLDRGPPKRGFREIYLFLAKLQEHLMKKQEVKQIYSTNQHLPVHLKCHDTSCFTELRRLMLTFINTCLWRTLLMFSSVSDLWRGISLQ